jgi:hypothetical protein
MSAVAFDTLKFAQTLRDRAKLTPEQAEGIASAFAEATGDQLVTKDYLDSKLESAKSDIVRWLFGAIGFQTLIMLAAVIALARISH